MANLSDRNVYALCPIIDTSDDRVHRIDNGDGPWCPEDYDPEFLDK